MDLVALIGLISSVTGIISFILYFVDKRSPSKNSQNLKRGSVSVQNWKLWAVVTILSVCVLVFTASQRTTGIDGNNNDNNNIFIESGN